MAILDTVKKIIPYIKDAAGYILCHISSQAIEMDDGTVLQDKIESMDTKLGYLDGATSNIQGQINTLNSNLSGLNGKSEMRLTHEYFINDILIYKKGNTVTMSYNSDINGNVPAGDMGNLFTLPEEYRPPYVVVAFTGPATKIQVRVDPNGKAIFYNYGDAITGQTSARFTLTYVV